MDLRVKERMVLLSFEKAEKGKTKSRTSWSIYPCFVNIPGEKETRVRAVGSSFADGRGDAYRELHIPIVLSD